MTEAEWKKVAGLLGLGARARSVVVGTDLVRTAVKKGRVVLAVVADDASENTRAKLVPLLTARGVPMVAGVTAQSLGVAVGREAAAVVAVVDESLARGIRGAMASANA